MLKDCIRRILALIKKEFITILKDSKTRIYITALPMIQLFLFSSAITMEVKNVDVIVIDRDNSPISRELVSRFENSPRFKNFYRTQNFSELKNALDNQKVQVGLYIDNDFEANIKKGNTAQVLIALDGRQTNSAGILGAYATQIITNFNSEITKNKGASINPVIRNWYNPNLEYRWYILVVIVSLLSLVVVLILTALSIAREREMGTFDQLVVSPLSEFEILLGKMIPPMIISTIITFIMMFLIVTVFKVPFKGSIWLLILSIFFALLSIVGVGLFISSICKTQQQAILSVMTFMMPAVLLSGYISPIEDMPVFLQYLTCLNPVRFYIVLTKGIFLKDIGLKDVSINLIPLVIIALITLGLAKRTFKRSSN